MFRMQGNVAQLYRYKINYEVVETVFDEETNEPVEQTTKKTEYCVSDEHYDEFVKLIDGKPHTIKAVSQTGNDWMDGMEFDSAEEAALAFEMGEAAYIKNKNNTQEAFIAGLMEGFQDGLTDYKSLGEKIGATILQSRDVAALAFAYLAESGADFDTIKAEQIHIKLTDDGISYHISDPSDQ